MTSGMEIMMKELCYHSSIGKLLLRAEEKGLTEVRYMQEDEQEKCPVYEQKEPADQLKAEIVGTEEPADSWLRQACGELDEYFAGQRNSFDVPLSPAGTEFQLRVWEALRKIPYGDTRSYGEIAAELGIPHGARAVGMGCNRNPLLLFVPCHRVVGKQGALTGFACGLQVKAELLLLEKLNLENFRIQSQIHRGVL